MDPPVFSMRLLADLKREHLRQLSHTQHLRAALATAQAMDHEPLLELIRNLASALGASLAHAENCYACAGRGGHVENCFVPLLLAAAAASTEPDSGVTDD